MKSEHRYLVTQRGLDPAAIGGTMPERKNERPEETLADAEVLEEMLRIAEKSSPYSPYLDNIHGYEELAEVEKVQDWAKEVEKCGHSISGIRLNLDESGKPDDPPDVLADMDGKPVGTEVTDLVEYPKRHQICFASAHGEVTILEWKQRQNGAFVFRWHGAELDTDEKAKWERKVKADPDKYKQGWVMWTLELFQMRLGEIVKKKDKKAGAKKTKRMRKHGKDTLDSRLHSSILLIFTPELYLQHHLAKYLEQTEVRRPENFDRVFLMGHYVPGERPRKASCFRRSPDSLNRNCAGRTRRSSDVWRDSRLQATAVPSLQDRPKLVTSFHEPQRAVRSDRRRMELAGRSEHQPPVRRDPGVNATLKTACCRQETAMRMWEVRGRVRVEKEPRRLLLLGRLRPSRADEGGRGRDQGSSRRRAEHG